jgi:capsule biosynthesis phosphatase
LKRLVVDVDNTISLSAKTGGYSDAKPNKLVISKLKTYQNMGFDIVLFTSRNMRTFNGNIGKINAVTLPALIEWLKRYDVPYSEIWTGKPWCGTEGFYVDDRAIRPDEFIEKSYEEIQAIIER